MANTTDEGTKQPAPTPAGTQVCPKCGFLIGSLAGSVDAICKNCGFKDPCCE